MALKNIIYETVEKISGKDLLVASGGLENITQRLLEAAFLFGCRGYFSMTFDKGFDIGAEIEVIRTRTEELNVQFTKTKGLLKERWEKSQSKTKLLTDTFVSVYQLPQSVLEKLTTEKIGDADSDFGKNLAWIGKLPKTDLHCHLGGFGDAAFLKKLAGLVLEEFPIDLKNFREKTETFFGAKISELDSKRFAGKLQTQNHCLENLDKFYETVFPKAKKFVANAAFLKLLTEKQTEKLMFGEFGENFAKAGLSAYTQIGNFGGSMLLQTEKVLKTTLQGLLEASFTEKVRYLEVRCSPENYTEGGLSGEKVLEILLETAEKFCAEHKNFNVNFIVTGTRHKSQELLQKHVDLTVKFSKKDVESSVSRVCGFDLAGKEEGFPPSEFKEYFAPLHENFMNITTHAGEMTSQQEIWEAIYVLHAKRIGHGLKLNQNPEMIKFLRDYKLVLEMCPSSNFQTNSFADFTKSNSKINSVYPLKQFLDAGVKVTVNTDNHGISKTNITKEFLQAAKMTEGGLSKWDILWILKNGFKGAFLPLDIKNQLLRTVDTEILDLLNEEYL